MTALRTAATVAALAVAPLMITLATATPAGAHGSLEDPVSRVKTCFDEGPESPASAACRDLVGIGGTQPLYDWNEVNLADAAGRHRELIPDGKLCSAGRDKYAGLDQARADWPASELAPGQHTFRYRATAPHRGGFELFITKEGYDPAAPLRWSDLESFGQVTDPPLENGSYVFDLTVPERSGRHLVYSVWQRSDSPEAFYTCSDVVFGGSGGTGGGGDPVIEPAPPATEPEPGPEGGGHEGHGDHGDHGDHDQHGEDPHDRHEEPAAGDQREEGAAPEANRPAPAGGADEAVTDTDTEPADDRELAATGGDSATTALALGGAAALSVGTATLLLAARRRAAAARRA
ncbi:lytic polysaccharide monooxygenase auxiliary activity family 9 protein [Streptomyces xiamenensis]|uniref:lytic polysaccharide monooxygenase auxiliary activity family 9 protein n=1 Tax=Streptomyces xiamenensis TaxID=408015 RepID=UPI0037D974F3